MNFNILAILLLTISLVACGTIPPPPPPPLPPTGSSLNIDRALLAPCQEPNKLLSGKEADVVNWSLDIKGKLRECSLNHKALVDSIESIK